MCEIQFAIVYFANKLMFPRECLAVLEIYSQRFLTDLKKLKS